MLAAVSEFSNWEHLALAQESSRDCYCLTPVSMRLARGARLDDSVLASSDLQGPDQRPVPASAATNVTQSYSYMQRHRPWLVSTSMFREQLLITAVGQLTLTFMLASMLVTSSRCSWASWNAAEKPLIDNFEPLTLYVIAFQPAQLVTVGELVRD